MRMRGSLASLVLVLVLASPSLAAPPAPLNVPVFPPATDEGAALPLALAIQARASALLAATGRYNDIHVKQILRAMEAEDVSPTKTGDVAAARQMARQLGADAGKDGKPRLVTGQIRRSGASFVLTASAAGGLQPTTATVTLPAALGAAVAEGGRVMAKLVADTDGVTLPAEPATAGRADGKGLAAYHKCLAVLIRQPIGIDNPTTLHAVELDGALGSCQDAIDAAPDLAEGWAALALALALGGKDREAVQALARVPPPAKQTGYLPFYWLARFWLVTRYQSNEAGASILRDAITRHPGFLLARGYLAELFNALDRHDDALAAWQSYQAVAPRSPFVLARIGYTLGKLGKLDDAIARTEEARALAGVSRAIDLELGSRYLSGGRIPAAQAVLEALSRQPNARGEVFLRLGYVHLKKGDVDGAEPLLQRALDIARSPTEWRTRGRARYDLARVQHLRHDPAKAQKVLLEALREGFNPQPLARADREMADLIDRAEKELASAKRPAAKHHRAPTLSLFQLDPAGEIDPRRAKPEPPKSFELIRF